MLSEDGHFEIIGPKVGVGVFVVNKEGRFIFGKRIGKLGQNTWALPGGHLEPGESFESCAAREVHEETNLHISPENIHYLTATNSVMGPPVNRHYVTVFVKCEVGPESGEPEITEPDKCAEWVWVSWDELVEMAREQHNRKEQGAESEVRKLFVPMLDLIEQRPEFRGP